MPGTATGAEIHRPQPGFWEHPWARARLTIISRGWLREQPGCAQVSPGSLIGPRAPPARPQAGSWASRLRQAPGPTRVLSFLPRSQGH